MVYQNGPSDRMQLAGLGELVHPACCMVCGSGNCDEGYVNLGVWFEYEGNMYLCKNCLVQAAEIFGCLTPDEANVQRELSIDIANTNARLVAELEVANARLTVYDAAIASIIPPVIASPSNSASLFEQPEQSDAPVVPTEDASGSAARESKPPKPVKGNGSTKSNGDAASDAPKGKSSIQL